MNPCNIKNELYYNCGQLLITFVAEDADYWIQLTNSNIVYNLSMFTRSIMCLGHNLRILRDYNGLFVI